MLPVKSGQQDSGQLEKSGQALPVMLLKNDLFQTEAGTRFRLLQVSTEENLAWVINLSDKGSWPRQCAYSDLLNGLHAKQLSIVSSTGRQALSSYTDAAKNRRKAAWEVISPLVSNGVIFDPKQRGPLVTARSRETGASKTTVNKYLRDYWTGGQTQDALIPDFPDIGLKQIECTGGRGRRPINGRYDVYQMKRSVDDKNVVSAVEKHYLKGEVSTLQHAFEEMLYEHYSYLDGNGNSYVKPSGERPSFRQFRTVVKRKFSLETILRGKKGNKDFERDHDQRIGSALYEALGVGHIYEIDATIADVFLVAQADRSKIIGKPTLYLIYDRYSRLCVGFYVGLEHAGWEAAMQAILSLAEDKAALCRKYNVAYDPMDWPAHGIFPQKFLGDCGEMISRNSSRICDGMQSTISNAPPLSPQSKGTVECGFRMTHASIATVTPGYEPPANVMRRRGKHYDKDACLTVDEFIAVILRAIISHNRREMKNYQMNPAAALREVSPTPRDIWVDNVVNRAGALSRYTDEYLRLQLLPRDKATVTEQGISFKGCFYECDEVTRKGWFVTAANRGRWDVDMSYDRRLVDSIIVHDPKDARKSYTCKLTTTSKFYQGYSFAEVNFIQSKVKELLLDSADAVLQERVDVKRFIASIATPAHEAMKVASKGKSRSARKADTAADRAAEKFARRQHEAALPHLGPEPTDTSAIPDNVISMPERTAVPALPSKAIPVATVESAPKQLTTTEKLRLKQQEMNNAIK